MRLGLRLILVFVAVSIIPIIFMTVGGTSEIIRLNQTLMDTVAKETEKTLENIIRDTAKDVAHKLDEVLKNYPCSDLKTLKENLFIRSIAVQKVLSTGYTAVVTPDGVVLFHPDPEIEGRNLLINPPRKLDIDFVELYKKALQSVSVHGYYRWTEPDGLIKRKFLATYRAPKSRLIIYATSYLDEMYMPVTSAQLLSQEQTEMIKNRLIIRGVLAVLIAIFVGSIVYASIARPLKQTMDGIAAFSSGNYSYRIPVKGLRGEINTLAALLNQFAEQLETTTKDLKRKTDKLIDSEARYRALVENMNHPLALVNNQGVIIYINPAFTKVLGYSSDEVVEKEFDRFAHPDDIKLLRRKASYAILRKKKSFQMQIRAKHKKGYFLILDINAALVYSPDDKWLYTVVLGQDVTETYKLQHELETAELILNQAGMSIALFSTDGKTAFVNQEWTKTHGYNSQKDCQNLHWSKFFSEKDAESVEKYLISAMSETPTSTELSHLKKDGSEVRMITIFSPFYNSLGESVGVICSAVDATEYNNKLANLQRQISLLEQNLKKMDREFEAALEKTRLAEKIKADFLSSISHELRTPLNAIVGFSKLLLDNATSIPKELREDIAMIYQNSLYLHELFSGVMELKEIDSGVIVLDESWFSLSALVSEALDLVKRIYYTDHLVFKNRLSNENIMIYADKAKIKSVLFNLISNAVKFTYKGEVVISANESDDKITVEVMDTGIGIPKLNRERIFERFVQLRDPMPGQPRGIGIGLSIAKAYVELHKGTIGFRENPEQGVTFWFTIPKRKVKRA